MRDSFSKPAQKYRLPLDFTPEAFEELERLRKESGAASRADTLRYGMRLLRWALEETKNDGEILVARDGASRKIRFPFLPDREAKTRPAPSDLKLKI